MNPQSLAMIPSKKSKNSIIALFLVKLHSYVKDVSLTAFLCAYRFLKDRKRRVPRGMELVKYLRSSAPTVSNLLKKARTAGLLTEEGDLSDEVIKIMNSNQPKIPIYSRVIEYLGGWSQVKSAILLQHINYLKTRPDNNEPKQLTTEAIADDLGIDPRATNRIRSLLIEKGVLQRVGYGKNCEWCVNIDDSLFTVVPRLGGDWVERSERGYAAPDNSIFYSEQSEGSRQAPVSPRALFNTHDNVSTIEKVNEQILLYDETNPSYEDLMIKYEDKLKRANAIARIRDLFGQYFYQYNRDQLECAAFLFVSKIEKHGFKLEEYEDDFFFYLHRRLISNSARRSGLCDPVEASYYFSLDFLSDRSRGYWASQDALDDVDPVKPPVSHEKSKEDLDFENEDTKPNAFKIPDEELPEEVCLLKHYRIGMEPPEWTENIGRYFPMTKQRYLVFCENMKKAAEYDAIIQQQIKEHQATLPPAEVPCEEEKIEKMEKKEEKKAIKRVMPREMRPEHLDLVKSGLRDLKSNQEDLFRFNSQNEKVRRDYINQLSRVLSREPLDQLIAKLEIQWEGNPAKESGINGVIAGYKQDEERLSNLYRQAEESDRDLIAMVQKNLETVKRYKEELHFVFNHDELDPTYEIYPYNQILYDARNVESLCIQYQSELNENLDFLQNREALPTSL